jgi:tetratricopeptide (TPR) repeat protein
VAVTPSPKGGETQGASAPNYIERADVLYRAKQFDEAIVVLQKALESKADPAAVHALIGLIYDEQGKLDDAATELEIALDMKPALEAERTIQEKLFKVRLSLADRAKKADDFPSAKRQYEKAFRLQGVSAHFRALAHGALGVLLEEHKDSQAALAEYRIAVRIEPDNGALRGTMADLLMDLGSVDDAIIEYQKGIRADPANAAGLELNLCGALQATGRQREGVAACLQAVKLDPDFLEARINLGTAYAKSGQLSKAIEQYREALRINPQSREAQANLEAALRKQGQK